jgi:hypothetical protein
MLKPSQTTVGSESITLVHNWILVMGALPCYSLLSNRLDCSPLELYIIATWPVKLRFS